MVGWVRQPRHLMGREYLTRTQGKATGTKASDADEVLPASEVQRACGSDASALPCRVILNAVGQLRAAI